MFLLAAVLFLNYVDRGVLPTAAALLSSDLHLGAGQLGLLLSAFFWTYASAQIPVGWLAERYGAAPVLAAGLTIWALATILFGVASGFALLLGLRLLLGLGESVGFPCVSKLLAESVPVAGLGTANGIVGCTYLFGPAVGTVCGGLLMAQFGWRAAFLVFGALSLTWLWPWARHSARRPRGRPLAGGPTLAAILRQPALWGAGLGHFSSNYTFYFMLSWLPFYLVRERGFSTVDMAQLAGAAYALNAACALGAGWAIDRFVARGGSMNLAYKAIMAAAHGGAVVCMVGMAVGSRPAALAWMFLYQALCGAAAPGVFAVAQILAGPRASGRWVGIQNTIGNLAGVVAPAATGAIVERTAHFTAAFLLAAAVSLLGLVGWLWMLPKIQELSWSRAAAPAAPMAAA